METISDGYVEWVFSGRDPQDRFPEEETEDPDAYVCPFCDEVYYMDAQVWYRDEKDKIIGCVNCWGTTTARKSDQLEEVVG